MRLIALILLGLISASAMAQQDSVPPPGNPTYFADMDLKGEVSVEYLDVNTILETAEFKIWFTLGLSDGIQPITESITVDYDAIPPSPCNRIMILPGAMEATDTGYQLISSDPNLSGVQYLQFDCEGQLIADLTGNLISLDAVLKNTSNNTWRLAIDMQSQGSGDTYLIYPVNVSRRAVLTIGNDYGAAVPAKTEWVGE